MNRLRHPLLQRLVVGAFAAVAAAAAAAGTPAVSVDLAPERLAYRTYPKGRPPSDIPHEAHQAVQGYCDTEFAHECRVAYTRSRMPLANRTATITHVRIQSSLTVTIWTEEGSGADVMRHEEAHRAIARHYYALTEAAARELASGLVGRKVPAPREHAAEGEPGPLLDLQNSLLDQLISETSGRCTVAQDKFDRFTYGMPPEVIDEAMQRAIAEESDEYTARAASMRPASASIPARSR